MGDINKYEYLKDEGFLELWNGWLEIRKKKKVPSTVLSMKIALNKLHQWSIHKAKEALSLAVEHGWRGIYEPQDYYEPKPLFLPEDSTLKKVKEWKKEEQISQGELNNLLNHLTQKMGRE